MSPKLPRKPAATLRPPAPLKVVPHEENMLFNWAAPEMPPTQFPSDDFEGLISVTRSGLPAGDRAGLIEAATRAGHANAWEYDRLIDSAEAAAKPIVSLSGNRNEFVYDVTWP